MLNTITRRSLLRGLGACALPSGRIDLRAAADSPLGDIRVSGQTATFSVDFPRPLESVVFTFSRVYGSRVTYEEAPIVYAGDMIDMTRNFSLGGRAYIARGGPLEFSYELDPRQQQPSNPRAALEAAVDAHNLSALPGRYRIVEEGEYFHIIPTARRNPRGLFEAINSPLDSSISLDRKARNTQTLLEDVVELLNQSSSHTVILGNHPFYQGIQPTIDEGFAHRTARSVLKRIISSTEKRRIWYLLFGISNRRHVLSIV